MKRNRLLAILLIAAMSLALLAGCGGTEDSATASASPSESSASAETSPPEDKGGISAGYHNFCSGVGSLDLMEKYAKFGYETIGFNFSPVNDEGSVEKSIQNVQNLISSGVSSIAYFGVADSLFYSAMQLCQDAGVYFGGNSQRPYDEEVIEYLLDCEYFAGIVADNNYQAGYQLGEYAAAQGYKTAVVTGDEVGSPNQDQKIQGFTDAFAEGGGEVLGSCRVASADSSAMMSQTDDLLVTYPDVDCMYGAHGEIAGAYIENMGKYNDIEISILCSDVDSSTISYIRADVIEAANGGQQVDTIFLSILMYNAINGHKLVDENGKAPILDLIPFCLVTAEMCDLFEQYWINDIPLSEDDIAPLLCTNNPEVTLDDFIKAASEYSVENVLMKKYEKGEITEEQMKAAGLL